MGQYLHRFHNRKRIDVLNKREAAMRLEVDVEEGASAFSPLSSSSVNYSPVRAPFLRSRANSEPFNLASLNGITPKTRQKKRRSSDNIGLKSVGIGAMFLNSGSSGSIAASQERRLNIEKAVDEDNDEELRALCITAKDLTLAAECAIEIESPTILMKIIDIAKTKDICYPEKELLNQEGEGLLHVAASEGACPCIEVLISKYDYSPNRWNVEHSETPMHAAASEGQLAALKMLRDHGGDLDRGIQEGKSVLNLAVRSNQVKVVEYLLQSKVDVAGRGFAETALHVAAETNNEECARLLIEHGCPVGAARGEAQRETALHVAANSEALEMICLLLKHSADPNAKTADRGVRPLHLASNNHSIPCMKALIGAEGDINALDADGRPPLHYAVNSHQKGGTRATIQFLKEKGADLNIRDSIGNTALHLAAASNRHVNRIRTLIQEGADLCLRNDAGHSALSRVLKRHPCCIKDIEERIDSGVQVEWITEENGDDEKGQGDVTYSDSVKLDFGVLLPTKCPTQKFDTEISMFKEFLDISSQDKGRMERILLHPLSMTFLHFKWKKMRKLYYFLLFCHTVFSATYTTYVVFVFNRICQPEEIFRQEVSNTSQWQRFLTGNCTVTDENKEYLPIWKASIALWIILLIFNIMYIFKETSKIIHNKKGYFREWESILNFLMILSFLFIIIPDMFDPDKHTIDGTIEIHTWQYHIAAIGIFITWLINMLMVGKIPRFGIYVQMLKTVGGNFVNFFLAYCSLVLAFALSFNVLFPEEEAFVHPISSFMKTLVMMTGELEYNDLYYPTSEKLDLNGTYVILHHPKNDSDGNVTKAKLRDVNISEETISQIFPFTPHILLALFVALVSIVIMNLLFGIAVSDVQAIHKKSKLLQSEQQVEVISYMENMTKRSFFEKYLPDFVKKPIMERISGFDNHIKKVEIDSYSNKGQLPSYLNTAIKTLVHRMQDKKRGKPTLHGIMKMQQRTEKRLDSALKLLEQLARANGISQPSPSPSAASLDSDATALRRYDSTDSGLTLHRGSGSTPRLSVSTAPNTLGLISEEEE